MALADTDIENIRKVVKEELSYFLKIDTYHTNREESIIKELQAIRNDLAIKLNRIDAQLDVILQNHHELKLR